MSNNICGRAQSVRIDSDAQSLASTFDEVYRLDEQRQKLLKATRGIEPVWIAFRFDKYWRTVLPRIMGSPTIWLAFAAYATFASIARVDLMDFSQEELTRSASDLTNNSVLITFLLTFYFGYCYNRHYQMYAQSTRCAESVIETTAKICIYLRSDEDIERVWRAVNLAHLSGYVGLATVYTNRNLLFAFARNNELLCDDDESQRLTMLDVESTKQRACIECTAWALRVISEAREREELFGPEVADITKSVLQLQEAMAALYHYQFQVMPFIYVHMISLSSSVYIILYAAFKGMQFSPESTWLFGFAMPLINILILATSLVGLGSVGHTLANPLGGELEDFAVLSFLQSALDRSKQLMEGFKNGPKGEDQRKSTKQPRQSRGRPSGSTLDSEQTSTRLDAGDNGSAGKSVALP